MGVPFTTEGGFPQWSITDAIVNFITYHRGVYANVNVIQPTQTMQTLSHAYMYG